MTSVTFPLFVGIPGADKKIPFTDAEFRFTIPSCRALERAAGCDIDRLLARGQSVDALVYLVCYGLRWQKVSFRGKDVTVTESVAEELIQEFLDAGGDTKDLFAALYIALSKSGVYGKPKEDEKPPDDAAQEEGMRPLP